MRKSYLFILVFILLFSIYGCQKKEEAPRYYEVQFETNGGTLVPTLVVLEGKLPRKPHTPKKQQNKFIDWYQDENFKTPYYFDEPIQSDMILYAKWEEIKKVKVILDYQNQAWESKEALYKAFNTDFYRFILSIDGGKEDLENNQIFSLDDFLEFCKNWNALDLDSMTGIGDVLGKYFLWNTTNPNIEDQPTTHFIGYCYQNGYYKTFLPFLQTFFVYWREDQGVSVEHATEFFYDSWSTVISTEKFFYFTPQTLKEKYPWMNSSRVDKALVQIPGVLNQPIENEFYEHDVFILPQNIKIDGCTFLGWYDNPECTGDAITFVTTGCTVYAKWT